MQRIQAQMQVTPVPTAVQVAFDAIQEVSVSPAIPPEELREMLMQVLGVVSETVTDTRVPSLIFHNIYEFCDWYDQHKDRFSDNQRQALDTLMATRIGIESGCRCRRTQREHFAFGYFHEFWIKNLESDLLPTIAKISNADEVHFAGTCHYPPARTA